MSKITKENIEDQTGGLSSPREVAEYILSSEKYDDMPEVRWVASNYIGALAILDLRKSIDELQEILGE